jgi:hypothetical protein
MEKEKEKIYEAVFEALEKKRDIEKCRGCTFFKDEGDGTFFCKNVSHFFGKPWCRECRHSLKAEWFEKATIDLQYKELCQQYEKK